MRAVKRILRQKAVMRVLGSTPLYPDWARSLQQKTATWKSKNPDWAGILRRDVSLWQAARAAAENGPRVLVATSASGFDFTGSARRLSRV